MTPSMSPVIKSPGLARAPHGLDTGSKKIEVVNAQRINFVFDHQPIAATPVDVYRTAEIFSIH